MRPNKVAGLLTVGLLLALAILGGNWWGGDGVAEDAQRGDGRREQADRLYEQGNFKEALAEYRRIIENPRSAVRDVNHSLGRALQALQRLGNLEENDALLAATVETHAGQWKVLEAVAISLLKQPSHGYIVEGEFQRGDRRAADGAQFVDASERDRVEALRLMVRALPLARQADPPQFGRFLLNFAEVVRRGRGDTNSETSWRLQVLTDLERLPDYDERPRWSPRRGWWPRPQSESSRGAPVDEEGNPILYSRPESWEAATSDGERWRWLIEEARRVDPELNNRVSWIFASFLHDNFGVQTVQEQIRPLMARQELAEGEAAEPELNEQTAPFVLHTLKETETLAKLATGVKRFTLPEEFQYIAILQQILAEPETDYSNNIVAAKLLAEIFENRQQYPRAAEYWQFIIEKFGDKESNEQRRRDQIVKPWGEFEPTETKAAGEAGKLSYRFRNGQAVELEAFPIDYAKLLTDVKAFIKSNPEQWTGSETSIENIGHRLVYENQTKYLGSRVAQWTLDLQPRPNHFDRRITIDTPLKNAGAYLVVAKLRDGNISRVILWLDDTAIVRKPMPEGMWYYVADAKTGEPLPNMRLDFFGFNRQRLPNARRMQTRVSEFVDQTDENGQLQVGPRRQAREFNWLVTAGVPGGRLAYLGFRSVWYQQRQWEEYAQNKVFLVTDRPVYRPGQTVKFKVWVRRADYTQQDHGPFAGQKFSLQIQDPRAEKLLERDFTADEFGGFEGSVELPKDATLGEYLIHLPHDRARQVSGQLSFRVEEYKKPEFEVRIETPTDPVKLGETFEATIQARYYFGAPVTRGTVKYKVERTSRQSRWYPPRRWDWLYGSGYGWLGVDHEWYPGFRKWGCIAPPPPWIPFHPDPPELVLENEVPIGPEGQVQVEIDSALALALHGDHDHEYKIIAEVVDESRRVIVGAGSVLVAREPFRVHVWLNRGYYRVGDTATASLRARTPDDKPIQGTGTVRLFAIRYNEQGQPQETEVESWPLDTDESGTAELKFRTTQPGQFRLAYQLTDPQGTSREGAVIFLVRGEESTLVDFRFNDLELIPDRREYQPGETVELLINANRPDATVLLFVRPAGGVYQPPRLVKLSGKSTRVDIGVEPRDMPNFHIEALTITQARTVSQVREIIVPPEERVMNVEVVPSAERYLPGEEAEVEIRLTDGEGNPIVGSTVLTVYDRSLEYISGGTNIPEIRDHFWNFRRSHHLNQETSLQRRFDNLLKRGETRMQNLGVFGHLAADADGEWMMINDKGGAMGGGMGGRRARSMMLESAAAPMAAGALAEGAEQHQSFLETEPGGDPFLTPQVRSEFADTAYWNATLTPDENGKAQVTFPMPENLTDWKFQAWSIGAGTRVGSGVASAVTAKEVLVRLQAPRFFVEKDEVLLSANVHNYLENALEARVELLLEGGTLEPLDETARTLTLEANGELRVDWKVRAVQEGEAVVTVRVLTSADSDAMQMTFPVYVHGMLKQEAFTGLLRPADQSGKVVVRVPEERRPEQTRLEIRYSPTLAGALVDALPYLIEYPYGCTEQTLNRFLPSVITRNVLRRMEVNLEEIREKTANLNPQELGDPAERARQWQRFQRNPVFDSAELDEIVKTNLKKLADMQLSDGGWGWFSGPQERSFPHTTATVVHGLQIAVANGLLLPDGMLERGVKWLERYQTEQVRLLQRGQAEKPERPFRTHVNDIDVLLYMILVDADIHNEQMGEFLERDRTRLSVYSLAMYGMALHRLKSPRLDMVLRNLDQYYVEDLENETAYLKLPAGSAWWYWHGNEIEANAYYLKLLSLTQPQGERGPRLVKYLLNNRKHSTYWNSTRDTALCIEAFADFLQASGEDRPDLTLEVLVDGEVRKTVQITSENLFTFDAGLVLAGEELTAGSHTIEFRKTGQGPLYWNAYLTNFTLEDPITATGLELKLRRRVYKLIPRDDERAVVSGVRGQAIDQRVEKYDRHELAEGEPVRSGDLLEIELGIDSKNDYEYIVLEDYKAAGNEPTEVRSGYIPEANGAYVEFRDERVAFFLRALPRGTSSFRYRLRAEVPGRFSALPAIGHAMYAPELKANSDEFKWEIQDRE